jgi:hypothetical protein
MGDGISGGHISRNTVLRKAGFEEPYIAVPLECMEKCGDKLMAVMGSISLKMINEEVDIRRAIVCEETRGMMKRCNMIELCYFGDVFGPDLSNEHFGNTNQTAMADVATQQNGSIIFSRATQLLSRST